MEKENWINEILDSTKDIKSLEANPFLFEKTLAKIEAGKSESFKMKALAKNWAWATFLIVVINVASLMHVLKNTSLTQKEMGYAALSKDMGLQTIINY